MMKSKTQVRSTRQLMRAIRKQAGMTLMEIIAALAIIAAVVVGALALFNSAQSSNQAVQMLKDIIGIRAAVQQLYLGQGGYGAGSLNGILSLSNKVPSDMVATGAGAATVINTPLQGTLTVTGLGANFSITITNAPSDVCVQLLTNASSGWSTAPMPTVNGAAVPIVGTGFPITPATATAAGVCGTPGPHTIVWTTLQ